MKRLKIFIFLSIFSTAFGVEEDEVTPELPVPDPFRNTPSDWVEDFAHRVEEIKLPQTFFSFRIRGLQDYRLSASNQSRLQRFDFWGNLKISRDEDFTSTKKGLFNFKTVVPMEHFWVTAGADYRFRKRDGVAFEEKSAVLSNLGLGIDLNNWNIDCSSQVGSAWLENGKAQGMELTAKVSHYYRSAVFHSNLRYERERASDTALDYGSTELGSTILLSDKLIIGCGINLGGWEKLWVYPQIRIVGTPVNLLLFKTEFNPGVKLVGNQIYLKKEFSVAGGPTDELHSFRWSGELVLILNELNSFRGKVSVEKVVNPVIWEWNCRDNRLEPNSGNEYHRRTLGVEIDGGIGSLIRWYINGSVNRCIDEQNYQIPNYPLFNSDAEIQLHPRPFILTVEANYLGKRFAVRGEKLPLKDFLTLSLSLTLKSKRTYLLFAVENMTDQEYELFPLLRHKGRKYSLELGLTIPD